MTHRKQYLFSNGEKLKEDLTIHKGGGSTAPVYTMREAKRVVRPKVRAVADQLRALPAAACPQGEVVVSIVMHPKFISKSSFPEDLLNAVGLRTVGARPLMIVPRSAASAPSDSGPEQLPTTEIHVAGPRSAFDQLGRNDRLWRDVGPIAADWVKVEDWVLIPPARKVKPFPRNRKSVLFEAALYAGQGEFGERVVRTFQEFLRPLGIAARIEDRIDTPGLSFVAIDGSPDQAERIAEFTFLRVIREMPRLRLPKSGGDFTEAEPFAVRYPTAPARDQSIRVLVTDGGMPPASALDQYVTKHEADDLVAPDPELQQHGLAVTSATLFGSLTPNAVAPVPFANVDHWRVLDVNTGKDARADNHVVLKRIRKILSANKCDFFNCSMGPDEPVDGEVNPWTATFDEFFAHGTTFVAVAIGNNGEADQESYLHLIQPPGDGVNVVSIGAHDGNPVCWNKASYSPVGTGRAPGLGKPDGLGFGGTEDHPYWVPDVTNPSRSIPAMGTSLAAPDTLRAALGVRVALGKEMTALVLKALLTNTAEGRDQLPQTHCGWGRFTNDINELIECAGSAYTVIYKDILPAKKWIRFAVPVPNELSGPVTIRATICYACQVDPQNPMNYTRAAMEVYFREDKLNIPPEKKTAPTTPFFSAVSGMTELELRLLGKKWETSVRAEQTFKGEELANPVFDLHYIPRVDGQDQDDAPPIPMAMIITVTTPAVPSANREVELRYSGLLTLLKPVIDLHLQV